MSSSINTTVVEEAATVSDTDTAASQAPSQAPNGDVDERAHKGANRSKARSKVQHVEAVHAESRPSCLSHEAKDVPSFIGVRNLIVLWIGM